MALFNQSTKSVSAVVIEIADSVGASADDEMRVRAFKSLNAGIEYLNGRANWDFTLVEGDPTPILGPFTVTGVTASAGMSSALLPAGHGFLADDVFSGPGVLAGTRISATAVGNVGFNSSFIGTGTQTFSAVGSRDAYPLPSAWKAPYTVKLYGSPTTLRPIRRRFYDRSSLNEFSVSSPIAYDIFMFGGKGKIRLLPPPASNDTILLRYYRRITVATASGDTGALDMPQDYEPYLIAWAKWHFITDKGEGRAEQGQTWISFAQEGFKTMLSDQTRVPDEDLMFTPGQFTYDPVYGPNQTRSIDWNY